MAKNGFHRHFLFSREKKTLDGGVCSYSVPSGFREDLHARPEGPSLMGWDGTEDHKCPLIFFIICGYIDKIYTVPFMLNTPPQTILGVAN